MEENNATRDKRRAKCKNKQARPLSHAKRNSTTARLNHNELRDESLWHLLFPEKPLPDIIEKSNIEELCCCLSDVNLCALVGGLLAPSRQF